MVGVPSSMAGQLAVAVVKLPRGTTKVHVAEKARALGPKYALNAVHTLEELGLDSFPVTSLGKPKKGVLAKAVVAFRSAKGPLIPSKRDKLQELAETLAKVWERLTGNYPSKDDNFAYFSDSITLLRYCDAVLRHSGRRLYLQDLVKHDTIEKQAKMLLERTDQQFGYESSSLDDGILCHMNSGGGLDIGSDSQHAASPSPGAVPSAQLWAAAQQQVSLLGLDECKLEDVVTVRESLQCMISGQRPQSFHVRVVFRVSTATKDQIRRGAEKGLGHRPMLRAIACRPLNQAPFQAILGAHPQLFDRQIREVSVRTEQEANELCSDDRALHSSEFMFTVDIISIEETGQCYLSMTYNHSIMDAVFLLQWHRDLCQLIGGVDECTSPMQRSYSLYADLYHQYQDSLPAQESVSFHVCRLRGISRFKQALWPPQRAPGWMISNDETSPHAPARRQVREQVWDGTWDERASEFRYPRRSRVVRLPQLPALRQECGVDAATFARCAVAMFNVLQTGSSCAVFNSWESGRTWPFVPDWIQRHLPPPMGVDGPTVERVLNMVEVSRSETVREFLARTTLEHSQASRHEHAPWDKVVRELREEGPVATDASFRQSFVWDVSMGLSLSPEYHEDNDVLEPVARHDWADL